MSKWSITVSALLCRQFSFSDGQSFVAGPSILLLNILTANMRNCLRASSRIRSLEPLLPMADLIPDEEVIDRIIPYVVSLLRDDMPQVRAAALETLVQLASFQETCRPLSWLMFAYQLGKVEVITPGNAGLVSEYILPNIRHLAEDEDIHVRSTFAQQLPALSEIGMHVMEMAQSMNWSESILPSHFDLDQNLEVWLVPWVHLSILTISSARLRCQSSRAAGYTCRSSRNNLCRSQRRGAAGCSDEYYPALSCLRAHENQ